MENKTCKYEDCSESVNFPHDEKSCVFHALKENKGITVEQFNKLIWRRINAKTLNFKGFIFPGDIIFRGECRKEGGPIVFPRDVDFSGAQFEGAADFRNAQFSAGADFKSACFSGDADFAETQMLGMARFTHLRFLATVDFWGAVFSGRTYFLSTEFRGLSSFRKVKFLGEVSFSHSCFIERVAFEDAEFSAKALFLDAKFSGFALFEAVKFMGEVNFLRAEFKGHTDFTAACFSGISFFELNKISKVITFRRLELGEGCRFHFRTPEFEAAHVSAGEEPRRILFDSVRFRPFYTHFERVRFEKAEDDSSLPIMVFRHCELKDVYFTANDMHLFSFFKSDFDQALFISSRWNSRREKLIRIIPYKRRNIIPEERFLQELEASRNKELRSALVRKIYSMSNLDTYEDIASLYRRMKTSLDRTKDYEQSGWFYFNEFEMKRRALKETLKNANIFKKIFSQLPFYNIYKTFAGYGEKPLWSFWWFLTLTFVFAILHLLSGLDPVGSESSPPTVYFGKYSSFSECISSEFLKDLSSAFVFSASRAIPVNYLGVSPSGYWDSGIYGQVITFFNSLILFILVIFIAVGLKRHFRRF